ncbi:hypothetical protein ACFQE5_07630 [Pseudonocardia hispaniensis]|uniref:Uncharacterized protein n=1 Tax=Pseudonocardia hispaniensis TaxID=904933 RepID=A0ABW1J089_9PSEU
MEPKDLNLYIERTRSGDAQADAPGDSGTALADAVAALTTATAALSRSTGAGGTRIEAGETASLSFATKQRIHASLQRTLAAELAREGPTLGLKPGDLVAISSSVGQSISF